MGCLGTSVRNYHYSLCNGPEDCSSHLSHFLLRIRAVSGPNLNPETGFILGGFHILRKDSALWNQSFKIASWLYRFMKILIPFLFMVGFGGAV
jgi:hypothetical protein